MRRIKSIKQMREEQEYANRIRCRKGRRSEAYNPKVSSDGETFWRKEPRTYAVSVNFADFRMSPDIMPVSEKILVDGYSWKQVSEFVRKFHKNVYIMRLRDDDYIFLQNRSKGWETRWMS